MRSPIRSLRVAQSVVFGRYAAVWALGVAAVALGCSSSDGASGAAEGGARAANGGASGAGAAGHSSASLGGASGSSGASSASSGGAPSAGGAPSNAGASNNGAGGVSATGGAPGSGGRSGNAGASGATAAGGSAMVSCPAPPDGATANAITAYNVVNATRAKMGVECANLVLTLDKSAQAHCDFYAANTGNATCEGGSISPHNEVTGCTGFTGVSPGDRVKAAGYSGRGWAEVMAFNNDPNKALDQWINSVWHRTPLLSPWWDDMGYGNAAKCDVIDQGPGKEMAATTTAMYPYAGQIGVPRSFNGAEEGPEPPTPPTGWPSGLPITLYVQKATTVSHSIEVMGSGVPLAHQWIDYGQSDNDTDQLIMYTNAPFAANTTYHVTIAVTISGAAKTFDWTFSTGS